MALEQYHTIGRRKAASARVFMRPGTGQITVNGQAAPEYFHRDILIMLMRSPLVLTESNDAWDFKCNVSGGGKTGQADAIKLGISRALMMQNPELRATLKENGFLTRDARVKERKKYGQKGARARFQFSKR